MATGQEILIILEALDKKIDAGSGIQGSDSINLNSSTKALSVIVDPANYLDIGGDGVKIKSGYKAMTDAQGTKLDALPTNATLQGDLTNITNSITTLESTVTTLESTVLEKIGDLGDDKLDVEAADFDLVSGVAVSGTGNSKTLSYTTKNLATGDTDTGSAAIPNATSSTAGFMTTTQVGELSTATTNIGLLDSGKADLSLLNESIVTGVSIGGSGDNRTLQNATKNLSTGATSSASNNIPLADSTQAGLMAISDKEALDQVVQDVAGLSGMGVNLLFDDSDDPSAGDILTFAETAGFTFPFKGITIEIEGTGHVWRFFVNPSNPEEGEWVDRGLATASLFTNAAPGLIQGAGAVDGKVYAEVDGTGSLYGWGALKSRVSTAEGDITTLQSRAGTIESAATTLAGRVTTLEGKVSTLEPIVAAHSELLGDYTDYSALIAKLTGEGFIEA